jgi:tetratricopeptide (TPR) repeat protein
MKRCLWLVFAVLVALGLPLGAGAQGASTSQQLESIRIRMETGLAHFVGGDHARAAAEFDAGYSDHPYSAFLFNAGVCYQKLGDDEQALARYREYLKVDPNAPDIDKVLERIAALEVVRPVPPPPGPDAGSSPDAGTTVAAGPPAVGPVASVSKESMRALVVVETEPPGAPVRMYQAKSEDAARFALGASNPDWRELYTTVSPTSLSLAAGR